jgi:hypothetical protein
MRASSTAAVVFIAALFVVGCSQSPSPSVAAGLTAPTSLQAAPASYDASGTWHSRFVFTTMSGEEVLSGEGEVTFTQDLDGNFIIPTEQDGQTTFLRRGTGFGAKVTYDVSLFEPSSSGCPEDMSGVAQIDVATNTLEARLTGVLEGCSGIQLVLTLTATKI